jgi:hypothetical protein
MSDDRSKQQARSGHQSRSPKQQPRAQRDPSQGAQPNEGEGNKTAAREYNQRTERFANSGQVEKKAREAKEAVDGDEAEELADVEAAGKSHSAGEDVQKK